MDFLPWSTFTRIVARYGGDQRVRTLSCAEHYRAMAFAQLTYRESLRDIETCLSVQASKLYSMGFPDPVRRSTLADANEARDWRIYAELAQRLFTQARRLYVNEDLGFDLANTVYALDSTTIDLCLAVFPWAHFRTTKAAVKLHTLLDLRGNIPSFIHVSDGKLHDVHALDPRLRGGRLCCSRRRARSTSWIAAMSISPGSMCCTWLEPSSSPAPNRTWMLIGSIRPRQTVRSASSVIRPSPWTVTIPASITRNTCGASASATPKQVERWCSSPTSSGCRPRPSARSTKAAGKSNCSSNGSSSICASNASSGHPKMP